MKVVAFDLLQDGDSVRFDAYMIRDLQLALRQWLKSPGFVAVAVVTLALGIGANTAIFSVVDQLLVRPLPVVDPGRLALVGQVRRDGRVDFDFNYPLFLDYQREATVFTQLAAVSEVDVGLGTGGATERVHAMAVSGNYFSLLGLNAALGRTFAVDEGVTIDESPVMVLSHGLWQRSFGADPRVIGRSVTVNGRAFTIIGVAPREFAGTTRAAVPDLYLPITMYGQLAGPLPGQEHPLRTRYYTWHSILGRLKEGVSLEQAQTAMQSLTDRFNQNRPPNTPERISVLPGAQGFTHDLRDARLPLHLLLGTSGLVLLIACANLANLQLARATARMRDFAIRLALGASRGRVVRELLTESVLLALGGGVVGMLVAFWLVEVLQQFRPPDVGLRLDSGLDPRVLLFAFAASVGTGILFGAAPALRASRPQLVPEIKRGGVTTESRGGSWNLRGALVVLQIALSLLVLVCAGLCVRSLQKLQQRDPGLEPSRVVLMSFDLGLNNYSKTQAKDFYDRLLEGARTVPGVEAASLAMTTPLSGRTPSQSLERVEGYQPALRERPIGDFNIVADGYFRTIGLSLLAGREFLASDIHTAPAVVIVNEVFAHRYWPGQNAIGKRIWQHGPNGGTAAEVVGVVAGDSSRRLNEVQRPAFFFPLGQKSEVALTLVVRTGLEPSGTIAALRGLVKSLDQNIPVFGIRTLAEQKDGSLALQRMAATLLGGFGFLALLLAALGIYGLLAYSVSRRTREMGLRMALGAQGSDVLGLILRQGLGLSVAGMALGLAGAVGVTRLLRGFLHQVQPMDPLTFGATTAILFGVAVAACWFPARRAARVDPIVALRSE